MKCDCTFNSDAWKYVSSDALSFVSSLLNYDPLVSLSEILSHFLSLISYQRDISFCMRFCRNDPQPVKLLLHLGLANQISLVWEIEARNN